MTQRIGNIYNEIATDYNLWSERVDPSGDGMTESQFEAMTEDDKIEIIVDLFAPEDIICLDCDSDRITSDEVPPADYDAAWTAMATEHNTDCEWIQSRAHRINN